MIDKAKVYSPEIQRIQDEKLREFCVYLVKQLPDYIFSTPASSSGKYHPSYALGDGGLIRHTKAAILFLRDIAGLECMGEIFSQEEKDLAIIALIMHDGFKSGLKAGAGTVLDHPLISSKFIEDMAEKNNYSLITKENAEKISEAIASHMGQWNTDRVNKEVLPKPKSKLGKLVHVCDYLASRKHYAVEFDVWYKPSDFEVAELVEGSLEDLINKIRQKAVRLQKVVGKETVFSIIRNHNGNANPNSISSIDVAQKILDEFHEKEEVKTEECSQ